MQKYQDAVIRSDGKPAVGATIGVSVYATGLPATIYSDNGSTVIAGSGVIADSSGEYAFYAANGRYTLTITYAGFAGETKTDIVLFDPADSVALATAAGASVGIGTASPGSLLHLYGGAGVNLTIQSSAGVSWKLGDAVGASNGTFVIYDYTNSQHAWDYISGASGAHKFYTAGSERMRIDSSGNVIQGTAALATTATAGFQWIASCAGAPTGAPTAPYTNAAALVADTTNSRLYVRIGSTWKYAALV